MANGGRIDYTVGFKADLSGLNSVKKSFKDIQNLTAQEYMIKFSTSNNLKQASAELEKIKTQAAAVELAFNKSFDAKLGTVNIKQFNNELLKTRLNVLGNTKNHVRGFIGQLRLAERNKDAISVADLPDLIESLNLRNSTNHGGTIGYYEDITYPSY